MVSRLVLPVALIAGLTAYAIVARHLRHKEVIARTIAYGATRRALEQSAFADAETARPAPVLALAARSHPVAADGGRARYLSGCTEWEA